MRVGGSEGLSMGNNYIFINENLRDGGQTINYQDARNYYCINTNSEFSRAHEIQINEY